MKVYNLSCEQQHRFEGWFASEDDFLSQSERQQISCPVCDSLKVSKLPSAPHLNLSNSRETASVTAREQSGALSAMAPLQQQLAEMVRQVVENTEDVGERFTEEARRIHYNEVPAYGIRGTASAEQREELAEEGIDVFQLPIALPGKQSLQ
ncbi:hypothetical protein CAter282_2085 [Collimonas arenae]|uniref:DUF1178 family protein n=1 Tax=Collimonas arenae TaxID=279058 RepID=A0A127QII4_9BURK|nr:DUF1178 family protein [Collimonas arenae]AMO99949.1 hypothetical protein CAter10_2266 [Collimonas arenae]AMP09843.1 hypothetical protein CAter282_2085 [Collimonas arenae]